MVMNKKVFPNNSKAIYNANFKNQKVYYMDFNTDNIKQNLFILEYEVPNNAKYEVYDEVDASQKQYIILGKLDIANVDKEYVNTVKHIQNLLVSILSTTENVNDYYKYHEHQVKELESYMEYTVNRNIKLNITREMYDNFIKTPLKSDKSFVVDRTVMVQSTIQNDKIVYSRDQGIYLSDGTPYDNYSENMSDLPIIFGDTTNWNQISTKEQKRIEKNDSFKGIKTSDKKDFCKFGYEKINKKLDKLKEIYGDDSNKYKEIAGELINTCARDYATKHRENKEYDDR